MIRKRKRLKTYSQWKNEFWNKRRAIHAHVPHAIVCPVAQVSKKWVFHVKLKSWLKPLAPTVPYLKNNLICFLRYSWLARRAFTTATIMFPSVWLAWLKWAGTGRSFLQIMMSLRCSLKWSASMYTVDRHLLHNKPHCPWCRKNVPWC